MKQTSAELQNLLNDARAAFGRGLLPEAKAIPLRVPEREPRSGYACYLLENNSPRQDYPAMTGKM